MSLAAIETENPPVAAADEDLSERSIQRFNLSLPARVEVRIDAKVSWHEVTRLEDVSAFGAGFHLKRPVKRGRLLSVSIPMPRQLRCYDYMEPQYRICALIRRCVPNDSDTFSVGVAFIGKEMPEGFLDHPEKLYELSERREDGLWTVAESSGTPNEEDLPLDLRRQTRFAIPEQLLLELLDENGDVTASEVTVTENLSKGGAAVFSSFDIETGAFIRVRSERHNITIVSIVRNHRVGDDGIQRLHLEFIDQFFPLEGIA